MVSLDALSDRLSLAQFKWTLVAFGFTYFVSVLKFHVSYSFNRLALIHLVKFL